MRKHTGNKADLDTAFLLKHSGYTEKLEKTFRELRENNLPPRILCQNDTIILMCEEKKKT